MGATNALALPIPELTEMADGPDAISDLANAVEDYVYDRILPTGVTRWPIHHWGSGTVLPTTANGVKQGDTYLHTGLSCLMRHITGTTWRQAEVAQVASVAARDALVTNYSALLYEGFEVQVLTVTGPPLLPSTKYRWTNGAWALAGAADAAKAQLRQTTALTGQTNGAYVDMPFQTEDLDTHDGHSGTSAAWTVPAGQEGLYAVEGFVVIAGPGSTQAAFARLARSGTVVPGSYGPGGTFAGGGSLLAGTGRVLLTLSTGQNVTLQATANYANWATQIGDACTRLVIERIR